MDQARRADSDLAEIILKIVVVLAHWKMVVCLTAILSGVGTAGVLLTLKPPVFTTSLVLPLKPPARAFLAGAPYGATASSETPPNSGLYQISASASTPQAAKENLEKALSELIARDSNVKHAEVIRSSVDELKRVQSVLGERVFHPVGADTDTPAHAYIAVVAKIAEMQNTLVDAELPTVGPGAAAVTVKPGTADARNVFEKITVVLAASFVVAVLATFVYGSWPNFMALASRE